MEDEEYDVDADMTPEQVRLASALYCFSPHEVVYFPLVIPAVDSDWLTRERLEIALDPPPSFWQVRCTPCQPISRC